MKSKNYAPKVVALAKGIVKNQVYPYKYVLSIEHVDLNIMFIQDAIEIIDDKESIQLIAELEMWQSVRDLLNDEKALKQYEI